MHNPARVRTGSRDYSHARPAREAPQQAVREAGTGDDPIPAGWRTLAPRCKTYQPYATGRLRSRRRHGGGPGAGVAGGRFPLPAHRPVRLPVRLRDDRACRAERQRGVALPAPYGLTQRVRLDPGPRCRRISAGAGRHHGPRRASLPAGHHGPRDELGDADRLDHRARPAAHWPLAPRARPLHHAPPSADGLRGGSHPAAPRALRERRGAAHPRLRARLRLRQGSG